MAKFGLARNWDFLWKKFIASASLLSADGILDASNRAASSWGSWKIVLEPCVLRHWQCRVNRPPQPLNNSLMITVSYFLALSTAFNYLIFKSLLCPGGGMHKNFWHFMQIQQLIPDNEWKNFKVSIHVFSRALSLPLQITLSLSFNLTKIHGTFRSSHPGQTDNFN